jgi:hypothetical protein
VEFPEFTSEQWRKARQRLYVTLAAAGPLLVFYGLASSEEVALWLGVVSAALGNGLAAANTRSQKAPQRR